VFSSNSQTGNIQRSGRAVAVLNGLTVKKCINCGLVHDSYTKVMKNTIKAFLDKAGIATSAESIHNSLHSPVLSLESMETKYESIQ
jgi:Zn-finger protein